MNSGFKNMDFSTKHWAPFRRRFPPLFRLISSDYVGEKSSRVAHVFDTCNFSLILRGRGEYIRAGRTWPVVAPCVITQWPDEVLEYGPQEGTWSEWYFIYARADFPRFCKLGFLDPERPVWPIADPVSVRAHLADFAALCREPDPSRVVDRIDRLAERVLMDTVHSMRATPARSNKIREAADRMRRDPSAAGSPAELAAQLGYSEMTFRRRWAEEIGEPPGQYLLSLRLAEACRLLVETEEPINQISSRVGFPDALYFSRRFHLEIGRSPRDYRKTYTLRR